MPNWPSIVPFSSIFGDDSDDSFHEHSSFEDSNLIMIPGKHEKN